VYYKVQDDEYLVNCQCGGKLTHYDSTREYLDYLESIGAERPFVYCKNCGYYDLNADLSKISRCECGGELIPVKSTDPDKKAIHRAYPDLKPSLPKDVMIITLLSLLIMISILIPLLNKIPIWYVPGSLFICFIPGYLLLAVMFPKNEDLEWVERFALSCGLSLILTSLIGLALNYTQWGIHLRFILIVLAVFTLILCFMAFLRMKGLPVKVRFSLPKLEKMLSLFLIISVILAIGTAAYLLIKPEENNKFTPEENNKFTDFKITGSITGQDVKASNYTLNLTSGQKVGLNIGLVNHENSTVNYQLLVKENNTIFKQDNITLQNNEKLTIPFNFTAGLPGQRKMEFLLYKLPEKNPYQTQSLWLNIR
jgi:uncharacterized membrane protein